MDGFLWKILLATVSPEEYFLRRRFSEGLPPSPNIEQFLTFSERRAMGRKWREGEPNEDRASNGDVLLPKGLLENTDLGERELGHVADRLVN